MAQSTASASSLFLMAHSIRDISAKMIFMARASTSGATATRTKEIGSRIGCMAEACLPGWTDDLMRVTTRTIQRMAEVSSNGRMEVNTMESGKMANSMER